MSGLTDNQSIYPVVRYRDPDAAIEWLKGALGSPRESCTATMREK